MNRQRSKMIDLILDDENGQDVVEYAVIVGLLAVVAVVALPHIGAFAQDIWTALGVAYYNASS